MGFLYSLAKKIKDSNPLLREAYARVRGYNSPPAQPEKVRDGSYADRLAQETETYKDMEDINDLPKIFHYWSHSYVRPMLEEVGVSNPDQFFAKYLKESAASCDEKEPVFISIGAGNCDTEVRVARLMKDAGLASFVIECLDMNPHTLARGKAMAEREGVADNLAFVEGDFNEWRSTKRYTAIMANQSLHHVMNLEGLFDEIKRTLHPSGYFVTSDMIGRNGHQRWPEALTEVHRFWSELPQEYRYNRQLKRQEEMYENWDCSREGFEGIRSQDIMPLLLQRFYFYVYIGFANVVDVFTDRSFGHNFNGQGEWDRQFVDRLHAFDEESLKSGKLTPTHLMAVLTKAPPEHKFFSRGLRPEASVRTER